MVKIFVGNLSPKVDVEGLTKLFEQYGKVSECDIIRNYGFVHMDDEDEVKIAFDNLNNYMLEGRQIHLEYSTSKLRKDPGMDDVCFRCGAKDHKTHNCPVHESMKQGGGGGGMKRGAPRDDYPPAKQRANNNAFYGNRYNDVDRYRGGNGAGGGGGYGGHFSPPPSRSGGGMFGDYYARSASASGFEDPLIPRPPDRLLSPLYEEYLNSRERYYYYRDRLERELYAMRRAGAAPVAPAPPPPSSARVASGVGYGNLMASSAFANTASSVVQSAGASLASAGMDPYGARSRSPSSIVRYPELYYARTGSGGNTAAGTLYDHYASTTQSNSGGLTSSLVANRSLYDPYP